MHFLWNTFVFFFGGVVGAMIGIAVEYAWERLRLAVRVNITAEYFDLSGEQCFYLYVWNKGFETLPPFRMTLWLNHEAIPYGQPFVHVLNFEREGDNNAELLTNQRATFKLIISYHYEFHQCEMTSDQAALYSVHPGSTLRLMKHNSMDTLFESEELARALCRSIAACKDGVVSPPREMVQEVYHWPNDWWEKFRLMRRQGEAFSNGSLILLLLIIVGLCLLIGK